MTIATDPPVSEAQRRAMFAAKSGHSTLGIPKSVGSEFAESDPGGKLPEKKSAKDMSRTNFGVLRWLLDKFMAEEAEEPEHEGEDAWGGAPSGAAPKSSGHLHMSAGPASGSKPAFKTTASSHAEVHAHLNNLHAHIKQNNLPTHNVSVNNTHTGEVHSASVSPHGIHNSSIPKDAAIDEDSEDTTEDGRVQTPRRARDEDNWPDARTFPGGQADGDEDESEDAWSPEARKAAAEARAHNRPRTLSELTPKALKEHNKGQTRPQTLSEYATPKNLKELNKGDESEETKKRHEGKLSEKTREEIGTVGSEKREDMSKSDFLEPEDEKYPVKKEGKYDHGLLLAAAREARMHDKPELASRADKIRAREFGGGEDVASDVAFDWSGTAVLSHSGGPEFSPLREINPLDFDLAYDRESARRYDADGHLHVKDVNIAKASVNEYLGKEIPDWQKLGLEPEKKYRLYRHPDELKRAVSSANGLQILNTHKAVDADTHDDKIVVGSVGTDARWDDPFIKAELVFWPSKASREIESNKRRALSPAYRYKPDMTPGTTPDGESYDGVMRNIDFSHLAQIPEGRQGRDVIVSDAALDEEEEEEIMGVQLTPKAAMAVGLVLGRCGSKMKSGMALDSALITPIFAGVTSKNYEAQKPALDAALRAVLKGKLANDADISDVTELLEAISGVEAGADTTTEANAGVPPYMREDPEDADDESEEEKDEDDDADRRARDARRRMGRDESEEECERREEEEARDKEVQTEEDPPQGREPYLIEALTGRDRKRAMDARRRLGRDESEEEREEREKREKAEDRVRARDRRQLGRDYRRARDAHRSARDAHRGAVNDWRVARDNHKAAMDGQNAEDAAKHARDMATFDAKCRSSYDSLVKARDARHRARDARRAHDKRYGRDEWPPKKEEEKSEKKEDKGMDRVAMDAAIERRVAEAVHENNRVHMEIAEAMRAVRVKAGEIAMDSTIHTAADVYGRALDNLRVDHDGIRDVKALKRLFEVAPRPGGEQRRDGFVLAKDAAPASSYESFRKRFPGADRIEQL